MFVVFQFQFSEQQLDLSGDKLLLKNKQAAILLHQALVQITTVYSLLDAVRKLKKEVLLVLGLDREVFIISPSVAEVVLDLFLLLFWKPRAKIELLQSGQK